MGGIVFNEYWYDVAIIIEDDEKEFWILSDIVDNRSFVILQKKNNNSEEYELLERVNNLEMEPATRLIIDLTRKILKSNIVKKISLHPIGSYSLYFEISPTSDNKWQLIYTLQTEPLLFDEGIDWEEILKDSRWSVELIETRFLTLGQNKDLESQESTSLDDHISTEESADLEHTPNDEESEGEVIFEDDRLRSLIQKLGDQTFMSKSLVFRDTKEFETYEAVIEECLSEISREVLFEDEKENTDNHHETKEG